VALRAVETHPVRGLGHADAGGLGPLPDVHADEKVIEEDLTVAVTRGGDSPRTAASTAADRPE
jgi:hypothetical protein